MRYLRGEAVLAGLALVVGPAGDAIGAGELLGGPPVQCGPGQQWDPRLGRCVIIIEGPGDPGRPEPGPGDPPGDGGGAVPPGDVSCIETVKGQEVPCELPGGWHWVQGWNAYARLADPQPPTSDPVWEGNTDGAIYDRGTWLGDPSLDPGLGNQVWSPAPPWEDVPNPLELAYRAVAEMNLKAVNIGIVPEDDPGRIGLLGLPTWMWAETPSESTIGPITRSASAGGYTVTATGRVSQITWDMGDGSQVVCTGPGTPYADHFLDSDSPDCGHRYQDQGTYQVTATSAWVIDWSGMGQSGQITFDLMDDTTIRIGEAQVLIQP